MDTVNLFFSCDENYVPFLAVTVESLKAHRDPKRGYLLRILHTGLKQASINRLSSLHDRDFTLAFFDISSKISQFSRLLHIRDSFTQTTYYRLFIPELFPHLNRGLYLDCDLLVLDDIAKIYDTELGTDLVAAASDGFAQVTEEMRRYTENRLGLDHHYHYFNAGVLLMNLEAMRREDFQGKFLRLLQTVTFNVAQDQDYLNVLCRDRVTYLSDDWNAMPQGVPVEKPRLVHFNLTSKPWHRDVLFGDLFWKQAETSLFRDEIRSIRDNYRDAARETQQLRSICAAGLVQAMDQTENQRIHRRIARALNQ